MRCDDDVLRVPISGISARAHAHSRPMDDTRGRSPPTCVSFLPLYALAVTSVVGSEGSLMTVPALVTMVVGSVVTVAVVVFAAVVVEAGAVEVVVVVFAAVEAVEAVVAVVAVVAVSGVVVVVVVAGLAVVAVAVVVVDAAVVVAVVVVGLACARGDMRGREGKRYGWARCRESPQKCLVKHTTSSLGTYWNEDYATALLEARLACKPGEDP